MRAFILCTRNILANSQREERAGAKVQNSKLFLRHFQENKFGNINTELLSFFFFFYFALLVF